MALARAIQRSGRWDVPSDPDLTDEDVERILSLQPFCDMDPSRFPDSAPLRDIVRNDMRFRRYDDGELVIRQGDFATTASLIVSGHVLVVLPPGLPDTLLGRADVSPKSVFQALRQLWQNSSIPEVRSSVQVATGEQHSGRRSRRENGRSPAPKPEFNLEDYNTRRLGPGDYFGEIAALARSARTATIIADGEVEVVEIRRRAMRDISRFVESFRQRVDQLYRANSLSLHLSQTPIFGHLDGHVIEHIGRRTLFETYGDFDWYISYNRQQKQDPVERLEAEPLIVREGDYPDGLLLLRSGFARVSQRVDAGERTVEYIGAGALFGFQEIVHNWQFGESDPVGLKYSLRAVGYADILRVPTAIIEDLALPTMPEDLKPEPIESGPERPQTRIGGRRPTTATSTRATEIGILEAVVEHRYINGTAAMVIDLDRCVRCDACVEACAKGHDSNPRFIRHGHVFDRFMIANACMHCVDPVCMIGCPTGAIGRDRQSGQVIINDATCIGCMTCASNCPYDNIRMVEIRDDKGAFIIDEATNHPIVKATKCDLCIDQPGGPACERACPHDALKRMHMGSSPELVQWLSRP